MSKINSVAKNSSKMAKKSQKSLQVKQPVIDRLVDDTNESQLAAGQEEAKGSPLAVDVAGELSDVLAKLDKDKEIAESEGQEESTDKVLSSVEPLDRGGESLLIEASTEERKDKATDKTTVKDDGGWSGNISWLAGLGALAALGGGGGGGGGPAGVDKGPDPLPSGFQGLVVNTPIANAIVFRDSNRDGKWNPGESIVVTKSDGSYTGLTGTGPVIATSLDRFISDDLKGNVKTYKHTDSFDLGNGVTVTGLAKAVGPNGVLNTGNDDYVWSGTYKTSTSLQSTGAVKVYITAASTLVSQYLLEKSPSITSPTDLEWNNAIGELRKVFDQGVGTNEQFLTGELNRQLTKVMGDAIARADQVQITEKMLSDFFAAKKIANPTITQQNNAVAELKAKLIQDETNRVIEKLAERASTPGNIDLNSADQLQEIFFKGQPDAEVKAEALALQITTTGPAVYSVWFDENGTGVELIDAETSTDGFNSRVATGTFTADDRPVGNLTVSAVTDESRVELEMVATPPLNFQSSRVLVSAVGDGSTSTADVKGATGEVTSVNVLATGGTNFTNAEKSIDLTQSGVTKFGDLKKGDLIKLEILGRASPLSYEFKGTELTQDALWREVVNSFNGNVNKDQRFEYITGPNNVSKLKIIWSDELNHANNEVNLVFWNGDIPSAPIYPVNDEQGAVPVYSTAELNLDLKGKITDDIIVKATADSADAIAHISGNIELNADITVNASAEDSLADADIHNAFGSVGYVSVDSTSDNSIASLEMELKAGRTLLTVDTITVHAHSEANKEDEGFANAEVHIHGHSSDATVQIKGNIELMADGQNDRAHLGVNEESTDVASTVLGQGALGRAITVTAGGTDSTAEAYIHNVSGSVSDVSAISTGLASQSTLEMEIQAGETLRFDSVTLQADSSRVAMGESADATVSLRGEEGEPGSIGNFQQNNEEPTDHGTVTIAGAVTVEAVGQNDIALLKVNADPDDQGYTNLVATDITVTAKGNGAIADADMRNVAGTALDIDVNASGTNEVQGFSFLSFFNRSVGVVKNLAVGDIITFSTGDGSNDSVSYTVKTGETGIDRNINTLLTNLVASFNTQAETKGLGVSFKTQYDYFDLETGNVIDKTGLIATWDSIRNEVTANLSLVRQGGSVIEISNPLNPIYTSNQKFADYFFEKDGTVGSHAHLELQTENTGLAANSLSVTADAQSGEAIANVSGEVGFKDGINATASELLAHANLNINASGSAATQLTNNVDINVQASAASTEADITIRNASGSVGNVSVDSTGDNSYASLDLELKNGRTLTLETVTVHAHSEGEEYFAEADVHIHGHSSDATVQIKGDINLMAEGEDDRAHLGLNEESTDLASTILGGGAQVSDITVTASGEDSTADADMHNVSGSVGNVSLDSTGDNSYAGLDLELKNGRTLTVETITVHAHSEGEEYSAEADVHIHGHSSDATVQIKGDINLMAEGQYDRAHLGVNEESTDLASTVLGSGAQVSDITVTASGEDSTADVFIHQASGRGGDVKATATGDDANVYIEVGAQADKTLSVGAISVIADSTVVAGASAEAGADFRGETGRVSEQNRWSPLNTISTDHGTVEVNGDIQVIAEGADDRATLGINDGTIDANNNLVLDRGYTLLRQGDNENITVQANGTESSANALIYNAMGNAGRIDVVASGTSEVQGFDFLYYFRPEVGAVIAADDVLVVNIDGSLFTYVVKVEVIRNAEGINNLLVDIKDEFNRQIGDQNHINFGKNYIFSDTFTNSNSFNKGLFVKWDSIADEDTSMSVSHNGVPIAPRDNLNKDRFLTEDGTIYSSAYLELKTESTGVTADSLTVLAEAEDSRADSEMTGNVSIEGNISVKADEIDANAYADINITGNARSVLGTETTSSAIDVLASHNGADAALDIRNARGKATSVDVRATDDDSTASLNLQVRTGQTLSITGEMNVVADGIDASADANISTTSAALQAINVTANDTGASADLDIAATGTVSASSLTVKATGDETDAYFSIDAASVDIRGDVRVTSSGTDADANAAISDASVLGTDSARSVLEVKANGQLSDAKLDILKASGKVAGITVSATGINSTAKLTLDDNDTSPSLTLGIEGDLVVRASNTSADAEANIEATSAELGKIDISALGNSADADLLMDIEQTLTVGNLTVAASGDVSHADGDITAGDATISGDISVTSNGVGSIAAAHINENGGTTALTGSKDLTVSATGLNSKADLHIDNASGSVDAVNVSANSNGAYATLGLSVEAGEKLSVNSVTLTADSAGGRSDADATFGSTSASATVEIKGNIQLDAKDGGDWAYLGLNDGVNDNGQTVLGGGDLTLNAQGQNSVAEAYIYNASGSLADMKLQAGNELAEASLDLIITGELTANSLTIAADAGSADAHANVEGDVSILGDVGIDASGMDATATAQINGNGNGTTTLGQTVTGNVVGSAINVTASGTTSMAGLGIQNVLGTVDTLTATASGSPSLNENSAAIVNVDGDFVIQSHITFEAISDESFVMAGVNMNGSDFPTSVELQGGNVSSTASGTDSGVLSGILNANGLVGNVDITSSGESSGAFLNMNTDADALEIENINVLSSGEDAQALGLMNGDVHITNDISVTASALRATAISDINAPVDFAPVSFSPMSFSPVSIETQLGDATGGSNITVRASGVDSSADADMGSVFGSADAILVTASNNAADAGLNIVTTDEDLTVNTLAVTAGNTNSTADAEIDGTVSFSSHISATASGQDSIAHAHINESGGTTALTGNGDITATATGLRSKTELDIHNASGTADEVIATALSNDSYTSLDVSVEAGKKLTVNTVTVTVDSNGLGSDADVYFRTESSGATVEILSHISVDAKDTNDWAYLGVNDGGPRDVQNDDEGHTVMGGGDISLYARGTDSSAEAFIYNTSGSADDITVMASGASADALLDMTTEDEGMTVNTLTVTASSLNATADADIHRTVSFTGDINVLASGTSASASSHMTGTVDVDANISVKATAQSADAELVVDGDFTMTGNISADAFGTSSDVTVELSDDVDLVGNFDLKASGTDASADASLSDNVSVSGDINITASGLRADAVFNLSESGDLTGDLTVTASGVLSDSTANLNGFLTVEGDINNTASNSSADAEVNMVGTLDLEGRVNVTSDYRGFDQRSVATTETDGTTTIVGTEVNGVRSAVVVKSIGQNSYAQADMSGVIDLTGNIDIQAGWNSADAEVILNGDITMSGDLVVSASSTDAYAEVIFQGDVDFSGDMDFDSSATRAQTYVQINGEDSGSSLLDVHNLDMNSSGEDSLTEALIDNAHGTVDHISVNATGNRSDAYLEVAVAVEGEVPADSNLTIETIHVRANSDMSATGDTALAEAYLFGKTGDIPEQSRWKELNSASTDHGTVQINGDITVTAAGLEDTAYLGVNDSGPDGVTSDDGYTVLNGGNVTLAATGTSSDVEAYIHNANGTLSDVSVTASGNSEVQGFDFLHYFRPSFGQPLNANDVFSLTVEGTRLTYRIKAEEVGNTTKINALLENVVKSFEEQAKKLDLDLKFTSSYIETDRETSRLVPFEKGLFVTWDSFRPEDRAIFGLDTAQNLAVDNSIVQSEDALHFYRNEGNRDSTAYFELKTENGGVTIETLTVIASAQNSTSSADIEGDLAITGDIKVSATEIDAEASADIGGYSTDTVLGHMSDDVPVGSNITIEATNTDSTGQAVMDHVSGYVNAVQITSTGDDSDAYLEVAVKADKTLEVETITVKANSDLSKVGNSALAEAYFYGQTGDIPEQQRWNLLDPESTDHGTVEINGDITVTAAGYEDEAYLGVNDSGPDGVSSDDGYTVLNGGNLTLAATGTTSVAEAYIHNANGDLSNVSVTAGGNSEVQGFDFLHYFRPSGGNGLRANDEFSITVEGKTLTYKVLEIDRLNTDTINALLEKVVTSFNAQAAQQNLDLQFTSSYIETDRETSRLVPFEKGLFVTWDSVRPEDRAIFRLNTALNLAVDNSIVQSEDALHFYRNEGNRDSTAYFELKTEDGGVTIETLTVIASAQNSTSSADIEGDVAITGDITVSATEISADALVDIGGDKTDTILGHLSDDVPVGSNITVEATNTDSTAQAEMDHVSGYVADLTVEASGDDSSADLFMEIEADMTLTLETITVNADSTASGGTSAEANAYLRGENGTVADQDRWTELNNNSTDHGTVAIEGEITVTAGGTEDWAYLGVNDSGPYPDSNNIDRGYTILGKNGTGSDLTVQATGTNSTAEGYIYNATGTVADIKVEASGSHEVQGFDLLYFFRPGDGEISLRAGDNITYTVGDNDALTYTVTADDARNVVGINAMLEKIVLQFKAHEADLGVTFKSTHLDPLSPFEKGLFATWDTIRDEEDVVITYVPRSGPPQEISPNDFEDYFYAQDGTVSSNAYLDLQTEFGGVTADSLTVTASAESSIAGTDISGSVDILGDITVSASELSADAFANINGEDDGETTLGEMVNGQMVGSAISVTASNTSTNAGAIIHNVLGTVDTLTVLASGGISGDNSYACADVAGDFVIQSDITVTASGTEAVAGAIVNIACADTTMSATMEGGDITVEASGVSSEAVALLMGMDGVAGDLTVTASNESADAVALVMTTFESTDAGLQMDNLTVLSSSTDTRAATMICGDVHITDDISVTASGLNALASADINGFDMLPIETQLGDATGGSNISVVSSGKIAKAHADIGNGTGTAGNVTVRASGDYSMDANDEIINSEASLDLHLDGTIEGHLSVEATNEQTSAEAVINGNVTLKGNISVTASGWDADAVADINREGSETTTLAVGTINVTASSEDAFADLNIDNAKGSTGHIALAATSDYAGAYVDVWVADNQNVTVASMSLDASGDYVTAELEFRGLSHDSTVTVTGDIYVSATGEESDADVNLMDSVERRGQVVLGGGDIVLRNLADAAETHVHIFNASGAVGDINLLNTGYDDEAYAHVELESGPGRDLTIESLTLMNQSGDDSDVKVDLWTGSGDSDIFITGNISVTAKGEYTESGIELNDENIINGEVYDEDLGEYVPVYHANSGVMNTGTITLGKTVGQTVVGSNISVVAEGDASIAEAVMYNMAGDAGNITVKAAGDTASHNYTRFNLSAAYDLLGQTMDQPITWIIDGEAFEVEGPGLIDDVVGFDDDEALFAYFARVNATLEGSGYRVESFGDELGLEIKLFWPTRHQTLQFSSDSGFVEATELGSQANYLEVNYSANAYTEMELDGTVNGKILVEASGSVANSKFELGGSVDVNGDVEVLASGFDAVAELEFNDDDDTADLLDNNVDYNDNNITTMGGGNFRVAATGTNAYAESELENATGNVGALSVVATGVNAESDFEAVVEADLTLTVASVTVLANSYGKDTAHADAYLMGETGVDAIQFPWDLLNVDDIDHGTVAITGNITVSALGAEDEALLHVNTSEGEDVDGNYGWQKDYGYTVLGGGDIAVLAAGTESSAEVMIANARGTVGDITVNAQGVAEVQGFDFLYFFRPADGEMTIGRGQVFTYKVGTEVFTYNITATDFPLIDTVPRATRINTLLHSIVKSFNDQATEKGLDVKFLSDYDSPTFDKGLFTTWVNRQDNELVEIKLNNNLIAETVGIEDVVISYEEYFFTQDGTFDNDAHLELQSEIRGVSADSLTVTATAESGEAHADLLGNVTILGNITVNASELYAEAKANVNVSQVVTTVNLEIAFAALLEMGPQGGIEDAELVIGGTGYKLLAGLDNPLDHLNQLLAPSGISIGVEGQDSPFITIYWPIGQTDVSFELRVNGTSVGMKEINDLDPLAYVQEEVSQGNTDAEMIGNTVLGGGNITVTSGGSVSYEQAEVSETTPAFASLAEAVVHNATGSIGSILVRSSGTPLIRDVEGDFPGPKSEVQTINFDKFASWAGGNDEDSTVWTLRVDGGVEGSEDDHEFTFSGDANWDDLEQKYSDLFDGVAGNDSYDFYFEINDSGDLVITWSDDDTSNYDLATLHGEGTITDEKHWVTTSMEAGRDEVRNYKVSAFDGNANVPLFENQFTAAMTFTVTIGGEDYVSSVGSGDYFSDVIEDWNDLISDDVAIITYNSNAQSASDDTFTITLIASADGTVPSMELESFSIDVGLPGDSFSPNVDPFSRGDVFDATDVDVILDTINGEGLEGKTTWTMNIGGDDFSVDITTDVSDFESLIKVFEALNEVMSESIDIDNPYYFNITWENSTDDSADSFTVNLNSAESDPLPTVSFNIIGNDGDIIKEIDIGLISDFTSQDGVYGFSNEAGVKQEIQKFYFDKLSGWNDSSTEFEKLSGWGAFSSGDYAANENILSFSETWNLIIGADAGEDSDNDFPSSNEFEIKLTRADLIAGSLDALINLMSEDDVERLLGSLDVSTDSPGEYTIEINFSSDGGGKYFTIEMGDYIETNGFQQETLDEWYANHKAARFEVKRVIEREANWSEDNLSLDSDYSMQDGSSARDDCRHEFIPSIAVLDLEFNGAISGDVTVESTNVAAESYATIRGEISISGDINLRATGDESIAELLINQNDDINDIVFSNDIAVSVTGDDAQATLVLNGLVGVAKTLTVDVTGQDAVGNVELVFNQFGSVKATTINVAHRGEALVTLDQSMQNALVQDTGPVGLTPFNTGTVAVTGDGHVGLTYMLDSSAVKAKTIDLRGLNQELVDGEVTQKTWGYADIDLVAKWVNGDAQGPQFTDTTTLFPKIMEIKGFNVDRDVINLSHVLDPEAPFQEKPVVSDYVFEHSQGSNDYYEVTMSGDTTLIRDLETSGTYFEAVQDLLQDATIFFRGNFEASDIKSLGYFYREIEFQFGRGTNAPVTEIRSFLVYDFDLYNAAASGIITFGNTTGLTERNVTERYTLVQEYDSSDTANELGGFHNIDLFSAASVKERENSASYDLAESADVMINDIMVTAYETMLSDDLDTADIDEGGMASGDVSVFISGSDDASLQLRQSEILVAADRENSEAVLNISDAWGTVSSLKLHGSLGGVVSASISNIDYMSIDEYLDAISDDDGPNGNDPDPTAYVGHLDNGLYIRDVEVIADGNLSTATLSLDVDGYVEHMILRALDSGSSIDVTIDQTEFGGEVFISGSNLTEEHPNCTCIDDVGSNDVTLGFFNGTAAKIVIDNEGREPLATAGSEDDESISFHFLYLGDDKDLVQADAWDQMVTIEGWTQNDSLSLCGDDGESNNFQNYAGQLLDFDEEGKNILLTNAFEALQNVEYYFGQMGGNGYLFHDQDGDGLTMIVEFLGVTTFDYTKIIGNGNTLP